MTHDESIQEIEFSIQQAKEVVAYGEALERLLRNKDFQQVIDQGYLTDEARRLTLLLADPNLDEKQHASVQRSLQAIGEFHQFIQVRRAFVEEMRKHLEMAQEELEAAHAEGEGEDA